MTDSSLQPQSQQPPSPQLLSHPQPSPQDLRRLSTSDPAASSIPAGRPVELKPDPEAPADTDAAVDEQIPESLTPDLTQPPELEGADGGEYEDTGMIDAEDMVQEAPIDALTAAVTDAATQSKKETSLREFLGKMDDYAPIIPDAVTAHYLTLAGLPPPGHGPNQTPPQLARLLALATQKFVADIAADSYQYARIRASNSTSASNPMGILNAASGLNVPAGTAGAGSGTSGAGAGGGPGDGGKSGKSNIHLGIQRPGFGGGGSGGSGQGRTVLTMEDLGMAVGEYGVNVKRGEFYR